MWTSTFQQRREQHENFQDDVELVVDHLRRGTKLHVTRTHTTPEYRQKTRSAVRDRKPLPRTVLSPSEYRKKISIPIFFCIRHVAALIATEI